MGINFGDNFKNIAMQVGSFVRNQKVAGPESATSAQAAKAVNTKTVDEFAPAEMMQQTAEAGMQEQVDFHSETMAACDWAADQSLAEAVDHFENAQVGNGLMIMSLLE